VDHAYRNLVIKAYPFRVDIMHLGNVLASHPRCYGREQDIFDPLHYLPLLEQRPGAFERLLVARQVADQAGLDDEALHAVIFRVG